MKGVKFSLKAVKRNNTNTILDVYSASQIWVGNHSDAIGLILDVYSASQRWVGNHSNAVGLVLESGSSKAIIQAP
ncbi:hypothetical protein CFP56_024697 [Quercus suber]|uniref:Uncharacterized protein n=1 Tax=Quercus suber TaxID=58331 RepID=A0AAW0K4Y4_QUESU